jgi:8-oxo-dGTP pyrophosphatase MutT (NUDIX family)
MNKEYHSKINYPRLILLREKQSEPELVTKVGIIPFLPHTEEGEWQFMLMKPHSELGHPGGAAPEFQIAKGTRRINMGGGWCDMRDDDLINADPIFCENLIDTALREGEEEIGLKRNNIVKLFDMGVFSIVSARRGFRKPIHIFAAEMNQAHDFGEFEPKTAEVVWITSQQIKSGIRGDHVIILQSVHERLKGAFFAGK